MKKITAVILLAALMLCTVGVVASAGFGSGIVASHGEISMIKTGLFGQKLRFSDSDFKSAYGVTDFDGITVTVLPSSTEGTLLLAGRRVREGQTIKRKNLAALVFVPSSAEIGESSFTFVMNGAGSGEQTVCQMKFIDKVNHAPEAEAEVAVVTQAEISYRGRLAASDPEGDELTFFIVGYPKNGRITLTSKSLGEYKYTPNDDFTGYDSFTYVSRDCYGNYSEPVTVDVKVIERMASTVYVDMTERGEYNAAVAMTALGIMSGDTLGDDVYFNPEKTVTKAEFVAMAMRASGIKANPSYKMSFFDDNSEIPSSLVGYVATAQKMGLIDGELTAEGLVFNPNDALTSCDAAIIMSRILGVSASDEDTVFSVNNTVPVWARPNVYAMCTLGIFDGEIDDVNGDEAVTRAAAAEYLYRMINAS